MSGTWPHLRRKQGIAIVEDARFSILAQHAYCLYTFSSVHTHRNKHAKGPAGTGQDYGFTVGVFQKCKHVTKPGGAATKIAVNVTRRRAIAHGSFPLCGHSVSCVRKQCLIKKKKNRLEGQGLVSNHQHTSINCQ